MVKLTKTQLKQLAYSLNAAQGDQTAQTLSASDVIAYSWNSAGGHKSGAIYWQGGKIYKTPGV